MKRLILAFMLCSGQVLAQNPADIERYHVIMQKYTCSQVSEVASRDQIDMMRLTKLMAIGWFMRTHRPLGDKELLTTAKYCHMFPNWTWDEILAVMADGPPLK